jgi:hypothetical protein
MGLGMKMETLSCTFEPIHFTKMNYFFNLSHKFEKLVYFGELDRFGGVPKAFLFSSLDGAAGPLSPLADRDLFAKKCKQTPCHLQLGRRAHLSPMIMPAHRPGDNPLLENSS